MTSKKGKHLINSLEDAVAENLLGYARQHAQLQFVPALSIIISKSVLDASSQSSRRVGMIAGAGSGHEPVMHGFVGPGGLDASVAGQVFASPSTGQVMETIRLLSNRYKEILLVVNNYTGDRLNFGLAAERAKLELGMNCKLFCFGDDVAFDAVKNAKTGRRGLAGGTLLNKCLGSLADSGCDLDQLYDHAERIGSKIATMSVSLTSCDVPGSGSSFELADNEVELGLGIHGEPGIRRTQTLLTSRQAVNIMIDSIVSSLNPDDGSRIVLLINNTGGLSNFDLNIATNDVIEEVKRRGLLLERLLVGSYCTSFSMSGVSVSLLLADDEIIRLLDAPNETPVFNPSPIMKLNPCPVYEAEITEHKLGTEWIEIPGVTREQFGTMVTAAAESMIQAEQLLNDLDRFGGDADCGLTARKGASAILHFIQVTNKIPTFLDLAAITSKDMGGTSGAIYSLLFTSVHSSIKLLIKSNAQLKTRKEVATFWSEALEQAIKTVTTYSWAEPGDRTMLDTVHAVRLALNGNTDVTRIAEEARKGAEATGKMEAKAGRTSYASDQTIDSQPDAGAVGMAIWIAAAVQGMLQKR